ncbi:carboxypeptidase-like regulatory domain-containing protein [Anatilimnocola sp. NA78]|uniref:carboxypeptidase-like regulatory domain-containing protein n=1 Tax=Anatilimnocola sp. NA78 TaxID=3415683 RepID=UPI003CE5C475
MIALLFGALLFTATGCTSAEATVSGTVTLDGQPLTKGDVSFTSTADKPLAYGAIDSSGRYQLQTGTTKGIAPGSYQVTIVANEVIIPTDPYASPIPKLLTPAKYSVPAKSGLTAEVKPGANKFDFDLKSMP